MNIIVDGRTFLKSSAGISTFLRCCLISWATLCKDDIFYLVIPRNKCASINNILFPENVKVYMLSFNIPKFIPNLLCMQFLVPKLCRKFNINLYFSPVPFIPFFMPTTVKKVIVVHDVVNLEYKETMSITNKIATSCFFKRSIKNADYIWANSKYTKNRVEYYIPKRKCYDIFVGCSVDRNIFKKIYLTDERKMEIKKMFNIRNKMLLFVGSLEPRKNLSYLISLMPQLYNDYGLQLLVVGGKGWGKTNINKLVNSANFPTACVSFAGYVSNYLLSELYNIADSYVSTSFNEGFGMPQLEAMLCGCKVVTADNSAMTEVAYGQKGVKLVKGWNDDIWINSIVESVYSNEIPDRCKLNKYDWNVILKDFVKTLKL